MPERNPNTTFSHCQGEGCDQKVPNHAWGKTKATGWFFSRDGEQVFCPDHLPEWVAGWRANKTRSG